MHASTKLQTLVLATILACFSACSRSPHATPLPMDVADLSPIQAQLDQLSADERELVVGYLKRSNGDVLPAQFADPDEPFTARTFGEAIVLQRDFLVKQGQRDLESAARQARREAGLQPLRDVLALQLVKRELLTYDQIHGAASLPPAGSAKSARSGNSDRQILVLTYRLSNRSDRTLAAFSGSARIPSGGLMPLAQCFIDERGELAPGASRDVRCGDVRREADAEQRRVLTRSLADLQLSWEPRELRFVDGSVLKGPL